MACTGTPTRGRALLVTAMVVVREHGRLVALRAAELQAQIVPAIGRARRAIRRAARRIRHASHEFVRETYVAPWQAARAWLDLLPIGRGHPPPVFALTA